MKTATTPQLAWQPENHPPQFKNSREQTHAAIEKHGAQVINDRKAVLK